MNPFSHWKDSDVALHNEKVSGKPLYAPPVDCGLKESELHALILAECQRRGWIALHGSMAHRAMRTAGEWDFVIIRDSGRVLLIECKVGRNKLSPDQQAMHAWARKLGHNPYVVRSLEQFLAVSQIPP